MSEFEPAQQTPERNTLVERIQSISAFAIELAQSSYEALASGKPVAYAAAGVLAVGGAAYEAAAPAIAEAHTTHGMAPKTMLYDIRKVERESWDPRISGGAKVADGIHAKKGVLTTDTVDLIGRCDESNLVKSMEEDQSSATLRYCFGLKHVYAANSAKNRFVYKPHTFTDDLNKLGDRAARSVKVSAAKHGDAKKIVATNKWARITFKRSEADASTKQLKSLTLRRSRKPKLTWYISEASVS